MKKNRDRLYQFVVILSFLSLVISPAVPSWALDTMTRFLVQFETRGNNISLRDPSPISIEHFEIPLSLVNSLSSKDLSPQIMKHLIFEKDGSKFIRWVINPEDTKFAQELSQYFKAKYNIELKRASYFTGYRTSSRSYIVETPNGEVSFSVKVSTNQTGGRWQDKKQAFSDAADAVQTSDWISEQERILRFKNVLFLKEPVAFGIADIDQAMLIRDLDNIQQQHKLRGYYYIPTFTLVHHSIGPWIANKNGFMHPDEFFEEKILPTVAKGTVELYFRMGLKLDSPHAQNFLIEFDKSLKPTGRMVIRDLSDMYVHEAFIDTIHPNPEQFLNSYSASDNVKNGVTSSLSFGPLHGNVFPIWVDQNVYSRWGERWAKEVHKSLIELGLSNKREPAPFVQSQFYLKTEITLPAETSSFWSTLRRYKNPFGIYNCSYIFLLRASQ